MHLMELIHSKLELFRLEQRYTRRRNRRSAFVSEATYVDGEYIYSPASSYASKCNTGNTGSSESDNEQAGREAKEVKANKRRSMMVWEDWRKGKEERRQDKRLSRISVHEIKWDASS